MKVVICGSYGDLKGFLQVLRIFQENYGISNVFPNKEHMEKSMPCIFAHHVMEKETESTISARAKLMEAYFKNIEAADSIVVVNEKNGQEYYGTGTTIELGYALAKGKRLLFTRQPTNPNILSLLKIVNPDNELCNKREICTT